MTSFSDISTLPFAPGTAAEPIGAAWRLVRELHGQARISAVEGRAILDGLRAASAPPADAGGADAQLAARFAADAAALVDAGPPSDPAGETHAAVADAIRVAGSQARLAEFAGISQQHVSRLLARQQDISADVALKIEAATCGRVSRSRLRPDYWPASATGTTARESQP